MTGEALPTAREVAATIISGWAKDGQHELSLIERIEAAITADRARRAAAPADGGEVVAEARKTLAAWDSTISSNDGVAAGDLLDVGQPLADSVPALIARADALAAEVATLTNSVAQAKRDHENDLEEIAEEYGVTGPHIYDGCWHPRVPGCNVHIKHFHRDKEACAAWIAEFNAKHVEHIEGGWPDRALKAESSLSTMTAERDRYRTALAAKIDCNLPRNAPGDVVSAAWRLGRDDYERARALCVADHMAALFATPPKEAPNAG